MSQDWPPGGSASGWGEPGPPGQGHAPDADPWSSPISPGAWGEAPPDHRPSRAERSRDRLRRPRRKGSPGVGEPATWAAGGFENGYAPSSDGWGPPPPEPQPPRRFRLLAPVVVGSLALLLAGRLLGSVPSGPGAPEALADPGSYAFLGTLPDGSPVAFSSCRPIHVVVRPDNAPPQAQRMLAEAMAAVSRATGLTFVDDGPTDEGPSDNRPAVLPERYGPGPAPVLVVWATPQEVPDLAGDVAGVAGPTTLTEPGAEPLHVSGGVYLDAQGIGEAAARSGFAAASGIVTHELGHLVGLDHVDRSDQLMYPQTVAGITTFQPGDLAGLRILGQGPCVPDGA